MPVHRWPTWCDFKAKMTLSQRKPRQPCLPLISLAGSAFRLGCLFVAALALYGCSTPQPSAQSLPTESTPVVAPSITQASVVETAPPEVEVKPIVTVPEADAIFFPPGSTTVDATGKEKLRQHADRLKQNPKAFVTLVGYTDGQGSRNYNLAIAEERLTAVNKLLRTYGVSPGKIRHNRIGSVKTPTACTSADCRQKLRRVELVYSP